MTDRRGSPATILVVDDNECVLNVVVQMLRSARFQVLSATSGPEALQLASDASSSIDLLLSDIDMPGMSGPTLALLIRQALPNVRLIFMTGGNHEVPFPESEYAYLRKPFLQEGLIASIEEVFRPRPAAA